MTEEYNEGSCCVSVILIHVFTTSLLSCQSMMQYASVMNLKIISISIEGARILSVGNLLRQPEVLSVPLLGTNYSEVNVSAHL